MWKLKNFTRFSCHFEAYLEGGWVQFDPTRLAPVDELIRIGTGVDAGDSIFNLLWSGRAAQNRTSD